MSLHLIVENATRSVVQFTVGYLLLSTHSIMILCLILSICRSNTSGILVCIKRIAISDEKHDVNFI